MHRILLLLCFISITVVMHGQEKTNVYLFPGQGSDHRIFDSLHWDSSSFNVHHIDYSRPLRGATMAAFAESLIPQIDTNSPALLIGVSLGGMLITELTELIPVHQAVIISSAKCRSEIPARYRFQKYVPIYALVPSLFMKWGSYIAQPLVEPDRKRNKETFVRMLHDKDPKFIKRATKMIVGWERESYSHAITHIHGDADHTLPIKMIQCDYLIEGGSHMMTLTESEKIQVILDAHVNRINGL